MEDTTTPAGTAARPRDAGAPDGPDRRTAPPDDGWSAAFTALRQQVDRLETDVRQLQSQLANRA